MVNRAKTEKKRFESVSDYIASYPAAVAARLKKVRSVIRKAAPDAEELISYNMPAYKLNGMLAYFAGYENHIGLYAMPSAIEKFRSELRGLKTSKGTIQLQHNEPLPVPLLVQVMDFRVRENRAKPVRKQKANK